MKKLIFGSLVAVAIMTTTSCSKEYTCSCKSGVLTQDYTITAKKKDAKDACNSVGATWITLGGSCEIK